MARDPSKTAAQRTARPAPRRASKATAPSDEAVKAIADRAARTSHHSHRTVSTQEAVLMGIASGKSMSKAAKDAGVSRMSVWRWREEQSDFAERYADAEAQSVDALRDEVWKRATAEDKPSDILLIFLMKQRDHSFRENQKAVEVHVNTPAADFDLKFGQFMARVKSAVANMTPEPLKIIDARAVSVDVPAEMLSVNRPAQPTPPPQPVAVEVVAVGEYEATMRKRRQEELIAEGVLHRDQL
jgi:transposase-like protein